MKEHKAFQLVSLVSTGIIAGIIWHLEVLYHGWQGLNWLRYFHWALPISTVLFCGWLLLILDIQPIKRRAWFVFIAGVYSVIIYIISYYFMAFAYTRGPQALFLLVEFGVFYLVSRYLFLLLPGIIVAGSYLITRFFIKELSIRKFAISIVFFYLAIPLSILILIYFQGSIYDYPIQADFIHAIKTGIIIPFIIFALGYPYLKGLPRISKKWATLIIVVLIMGIANYCLYLAYINSFVRYVPVVDTGDGLKKVSRINTTEHKKNIKIILEADNVEWKVRNNEIYIKRKWMLEQKMALNYTNKALEAEYVKYVPVVLEDPNIGYEIVPDLTVNIDNLKLVLSYHDEKWKVENGQLFITQRLALDQEMIHNYTRMANDEEFVEQIK